ncbi:MAG: alkaline phosphatase family protein, partial [Myxococcota bacterium]
MPGSISPNALACSSPSVIGLTRRFVWHRRNFRARNAVAFAALPLMLFAFRSEASVTLIGVDGASWNLIDPMLASGELPNIAALIARGATANLETVEPVTSPVVWTSIATGRSPAAHGVTDFFATRLSIRAPSSFERLAHSGLRVGLYD